MSSMASQMPSPSISGSALTTFGSVPHNNSVASSIRSLSSSSSSINPVVDSPINSSGIPSPSVSTAAAGSLGKASGPATQISASGVAGPSQIPSPSLSGLAGSVCPSIWLSKFPVLVSSSLRIPSPSISSSIASQIPSPSMSLGTSVAFSGSDKQSFSKVSRKPSLSSSSSAIRPPSPSGSSSGKASPSVLTGSAGSSGCESGPA